MLRSKLAAKIACKDGFLVEDVRRISMCNLVGAQVLHRRDGMIYPGHLQNMFFIHVAKQHKVGMYEHENLSKPAWQQWFVVGGGHRNPYYKPLCAPYVFFQKFCRFLEDLHQTLARPSAGMIFSVTAELLILLSKFQSPEHILLPEHSGHVKFRAVGLASLFGWGAPTTDRSNRRK